MLKKVQLTDTLTAHKVTLIVDTDEDELAVLGSGKSVTEEAVVTSITGADEFIHRKTWKKPSMEDRIVLFGGLGRCLDRNISAVKALGMQAGRVKSPAYRGAIAGIIQQILLGEKLSDALAKYPRLFTEDILALIRAGEESGQLSLVCKRIADGNQKTLRIIKKLKGGMIYPAIVLFIAVTVVIVMSFTLVPAIAKLYASMGANLPLATRAMMGLSDILLNRPYLAILPFIGLYYFFKKWPAIYRRPGVQRFMIKVPTVGPIVRKSAAAVSFRVLAMLLEAGVRISTALEIVADSASHVDFREFFLQIRDRVSEGESLPESFLQESGRLGPDGRMMAAMMQIAGETGSATEMLDEIAADYEDDLDTVANSIDKILEPITIIVMGVFVGLLVYAIYGPIFSLSKIMLPKTKPPAAATAPAVVQ
ncbi:MAG: type II secretion system F family protein [Chthoniobacterales bacterium]